MKNAEALDQNCLQLLLEEYKSLARLILEEDQQAEKRVTFFLTLAGGGVLVIGYLSRQQVGQYPPDFYYGIVVLLVVLFLFGLSTLHKLNARWVHRRVYVANVEKLQKFIGKSGGEPLLQIFSTPRGDGNKSLTEIYKARVRGTLTEFILLSNSLLASGVAGAIIYHHQQARVTPFLVRSCLTIFIISFVALYCYAQWMREEIAVRKVHGFVSKHWKRLICFGIILGIAVWFSGYVVS
jgi:hypothetical protein